MNDPFQLVTNCNFKGKDYLVQMCVVNSKKIELVITDKLMAENWQCEYDASYIEALTHKTGNFKQFDVFVMMLKSGLLKTSDCISLDLLTLEDLEHLRCKKIVNSYSSSRTSQASHLNKRYLILTYSVEFDRIHYPLPLDYCGPPDPSILQGNIRRLENEIERLKQNKYFTHSDAGNAKKLKEKIQNLIDDNAFLTNEVYRLNKLLSHQNKPLKNNQVLQSSLKKLERQILYEKNHNHQIIFKLRMENRKLKFEIEELKKSESCLKTKLRDATKNNFQRSCRRCKPLKNYLSPENCQEGKSTLPCGRPDSQLFSRPNFNLNSSLSKSKELKTLKKFQNTFLSSSSGESEHYKHEHKSRSKEKKQLPFKQEKKSEFCPKRSREPSKPSSEDSRKSTQRLVKRNSSVEEKPRSETNEAKSREKIHSRESSLSSRSSSKQSKISWFSNRGSGDYKASKRKTVREGIFYNKADVKFSMSDLESRIHALQKLLNDGLNF